MSLPSHARYDYLPITRRPAFAWPEGQGLAFYLALNLEHFAFGEGLGAELAPGGPQPNVLNYAWRDYGNRVGAWRLIELFDELRVPCSALVNSSIIDYAPELADAFHRRGDELVAHGRTNSERQSDLDEAAEAALVREATEAFCARYGQRPEGWLGPWIAESRSTPDLLQEAGYSYLLDWCHDDQPVWMRTRRGAILSLPYPQEINDIPAIAARHASARDFADSIVDQFDEMLVQARHQPLVMGVALHPYIVGQPFRLKHLRNALRHVAGARERIWWTTAAAIARCYADQVPAPQGTAGPA